MGAIRPWFTHRHLAGLTLSLWKESPRFCLRPASEDSDVNPSKQPVLPSQKDTGRSPVSHPLSHPSVCAGPPTSHQMLSCSLSSARPALWLFTCSGARQSQLRLSTGPCFQHRQSAFTERGC